MRLKCCVSGCKATNETHRLFVFPKKDMLRNLWMSFLVPTNPLLLGLSKEQLLRKRVCEKHFDKHQFDKFKGKRLRFSYPCLFTDDEITHGEPLAAVGTVRNALSDHNYFKDQDDEEDTLIIVDKKLVIGRPGEDFHEHPSCSYSQVEASVSDNKGTYVSLCSVTQCEVSKTCAIENHGCRMCVRAIQKTAILKRNQL
ncbi:uncharacterized protein LOC134751589 [Cydia strobilella]|uniref:uncharacterized protein LOC134751589 n=1 Tax=Cydia strobilella TaxID=1100964 RepID=UPI00300727D1